MNTVQMLKALGDETRIRIVNILRDGPLCVCEIESILEITQSNASRHLSKLMNANIVTYYKEAKYVYYKLDEETLNKYSFIKVLLENELDEDEKLKNPSLVCHYLYDTSIYNTPKCKDCALFPVCDGGCQWFKHQNIFENKKYNTCCFLNDQHILEECLLANVDKPIENTHKISAI